MLRAELLALVSTTSAKVAAAVAVCGLLASQLAFVTLLPAIVRGDIGAAEGASEGLSGFDMASPATQLDALSPLGASLSGSQVFWDGAQFMAFSAGQRHTSPDGVSWTSAAITPAITVGAIARANDGTLAAVRGGWQYWYDDQAFYRSTDDGLTWETLPTGSFTGGHPIGHMVFGEGDASATCP